MATGVPINFRARELRKHVVRQADHFLSDTLGYPEDHPVRLSIAKRLAEAEELASE